MLVKTLDGDEYEWSISEKIAKGNRRKTSKGHALAKSIISEFYPGCRLYEEVPIILQGTGRQKTQVYLDIYIPSLSLAIEIQGGQHYEYSSFFHKSKLDFLKAQQRDRNKAEWCSLNNITLITLPYGNEKEWKTLLMIN
jgi:hypothetical protein